MCVIIGAYAGRRIIYNKKIILTILLMNVFAPFVTCFPVCLAYSSADFPNRCKFIEVVVLIIVSMSTAFIFGMLWGQVFGHKQIMGWIYILCVTLLIMPSLNSKWRLSELKTYQVMSGVGEGVYEAYYNQVNDIYNFIENSDCDDVVIDSLPEPIENFPSIRISEDTNNWENIDIAKFYHKQSVKLISENDLQND